MDRSDRIELAIYPNKALDYMDLSAKEAHAKCDNKPNTLVIKSING
jgi:hypothetical protein